MMVLNLSVSIALVISSYLASSTSAYKHGSWRKYYNYTHNNSTLSNNTGEDYYHNGTYPYDRYNSSKPDCRGKYKKYYSSVSGHGSKCVDSSDTDSSSSDDSRKNKRSSRSYKHSSKKNKHSSKSDKHSSKSHKHYSKKSNDRGGHSSKSKKRSGSGRSGRGTSSSDGGNNGRNGGSICANIECYASGPYYPGGGGDGRRGKNYTYYDDGRGHNGRGRNYTYYDGPNWGRNYTYYNEGGRYNRAPGNYTDYYDYYDGRKYRNHTHYDGGYYYGRNNGTYYYDGRNHTGGYYPPRNYTPVEECCCVTYPQYPYKCDYLFQGYGQDGSRGSGGRRHKSSQFARSSTTSDSTKRKYTNRAYGFCIALLCTATAALGWRKRSSQRDEKAVPLGASKGETAPEQPEQSIVNGESYVRAG